MRKTFEVMNIPLMEEQEIKQLIGLPLIEMFRRLTHLDEKGVELAAATYRAHFTDFAMGVAQPFPHVAETLKRLHEEGYKLAIATSRGRESLVMLLKELNLLQYFDEMATDQDVEEKKPAPEMVLYLLEKMQTKKENALVVGDTIFDIEMGQRAGCMTCGVTYGNNTRQQLVDQKADFVIDDFGELGRSPFKPL
jgi:phosphoglycolate phosphatase